MKKILVVFGTRPEAIKMAPLCHALRAKHGEFDLRICVTGQHRDMLDQVLGVFNIVPDIDLDIMRPGQTLFDITARILVEMKAVIESEKPDIVLVHGDTTTAFASALAAFYSGVAVGHVEAGLRTHDLHAPFPEEMNRQFVGRLASVHFAPTDKSVANLAAEAVPAQKIFKTGNTVIDALQWILKRLASEPARADAILLRLAELVHFPLVSERYVLVTGHRRENFGQGFEQITAALAELAGRYPGVHFVYPVHLNPNVASHVHAALSGIENIHLISPQEYEPFALLLQHCHIVLTDSGGIQEEAPSLGKPVLVMRDVTERPEAVDAGTVRLVGADQARIVTELSALLDDAEHYQAMAHAHNPYGDGNACERIVTHLREILV
ncbi:non-hydrolyzing UDP-N-acetylglucosamine 2-epimerase [Rhizobium sp. BE258]|uniref:non-hydrolyzing UDP-N-acetylglucosamine 2-epimerase n=1 Tax=Rhizobium sp. BE258 TaxID=2817722 RepID=UPI002862A990|nr:UDP-N-acetylglucosamine 2-epimerase (non-hydrolyzing) [Rhizobium sp. BE258]MDR7142218.1 UDP-N-acetylglucosamine 2-epimerase (non-hydrolyzing) [Rhizobium sp. BE258]